MSILDRTAHDGHLQTHAASGWPGCVPVRGERRRDQRAAPLDQCHLSGAADNVSDTLTQNIKRMPPAFAHELQRSYCAKCK